MWGLFPPGMGTAETSSPNVHSHFFLLHPAISCSLNTNTSPSPADLAPKYLLNSSQSDLAVRNLTIFLYHLKPFSVPPSIKWDTRHGPWMQVSQIQIPALPPPMCVTQASHLLPLCLGFSVRKMGVQVSSS